MVKIWIKNADFSFMWQKNSIRQQISACKLKITKRGHVKCADASGFFKGIVKQNFDGQNM